MMQQYEQIVKNFKKVSEHDVLNFPWNWAHSKFTNNVQPNLKAALFEGDTRLG